MFEEMTNETEDRGQVGIGTLIVFIALVLVAAIAAGVLINTAGFLQSQAESTGQESTNQVSDRVQMTSVVGTSSSDDGTLESVELSLELAPGSSPVALNQATLEYVEDGQAIFTVDSSNAEVSSVEDLGGNAITQLDSDTTAVVTLDMTGGDLPGALAAGDEADVTITTAKGGQTQETVSVPNPLQDEQNGVRL
jgi:flagellin FlaB